jgi:hypothetical protein
MIRRTIRLAAVTAMTLLLVPAAATANMANPSQPGDPAGEPGGELDQMHVEHERLNIDMRPLERAEPARVEATYSIRNDGPARAVELVFVASGLDGTESGVWLNGAPVDFRLANDALPVPWLPPATTPGLERPPLPYEDAAQGQLLFTLTLAPGQHDVKVSYTAAAGAYSGSSPTRYWQLGYVHTPARSWSSFGTLDVSVQLPAGWAAASDPPLDRMGDELRASFEGVPADSLAITAQAPPPGTTALWFLAAAAVVVVLSALLARAGGRFLGRRRRSSLWLLPASLVGGIVGGFVVVMVGIGTLGGQFIPAAQRAWTYGNTAGILLLLSFPMIALGLVLLIQIVGALARRRAVRGT